MPQKVEWLDTQISGSGAGKVAGHPDNAGKVAQMPIFSRQIQNPAAKMRPKCTMSYGHYSVRFGLARALVGLTTYL